VAEKIFEDDELIAKRFPCACRSQSHSLDVYVELADDGKRVVECGFDLYMAGKAPLKYRLRQIWKLLRGEDGQLADFLLRPEDVPEMIDILSKVAGKAKGEPVGGN